MRRSRFIRDLPIIGGTRFSPTSIANLALWLDASDASSLTLDGSNNVSQWNDKSGNARHVTQAAVNSRPAYVTSVVNGLSVVRTDGVDDQLYSSTISSSNWFSATKDRITMVALCRRVSGTGNFWYHISDNTTGSGERCLMERQSPPSPGDFLVQTNSGGAYLVSAPEIGTSLAIETMRWQSGSNYTIRRFISGSASNYSSIDPVGGTMENPKLFSIGALVQRVNADFCEIMVWPRVLSDLEVVQLEQYLVNKWGTI